MSGNFERLYTDPGVSRAELPAITEGIMRLASNPYRDEIADAGPGRCFVFEDAPDGTSGLTVPKPSPGERVQITADFCMCPACREARYEPVPPDSSNEG
jgi:hypothetical protein